MRSLALLALLAALALPAPAQSAWTTTLVWGDGNSADRLDVVIMGDGYTAAEIPVFHTHVTNFVNAWLATAPINRYRNFVNIWRVDVESAQSGADKPSPCWATPTLVNTALDAKYCTGGIQRCLTANNSK